MLYLWFFSFPLSSFLSWLLFPLVSHFSFNLLFFSFFFKVWQHTKKVTENNDSTDSQPTDIEASNSHPNRRRVSEGLWRQLRPPEDFKRAHKIQSYSCSLVDKMADVATSSLSLSILAVSCFKLISSSRWRMQSMSVLKLELHSLPEAR